MSKWLLWLTLSREDLRWPILDRTGVLGLTSDGCTIQRIISWRTSIEEREVGTGSGASNNDMLQQACEIQTVQA